MNFFSRNISMNAGTKSLFLTMAVFGGTQAWAEKYMVVLKDKAIFAKAHAQFQNKMALNQVTRLQSGLRIEQSLEHLQTLIVSSDNEAQIQALRNSEQVASVEKEVIHPAPKPIAGFVRTTPWNFSLRYSVKPQDFTDATTLGKGTPWGIQAVHAPQAWTLSRRGAGARVMVLDTGIDKDHPALKENFEKGRDFAGNSSGLPYPFADSEGHGTHCSGTIAGALAADGFSGVAPEAKILMGRVCTQEGCSSLAVAAGMNWAIQEKVDVLSLSLGGAKGSPVESRGIQALSEAGITVIAASGNGDEKGNGLPQVGFPAAFSSVIAVGAIDSKLAKAGFSNWGPELAVVGPGVDVLSSVPMGSGRDSSVTVDGHPVKASVFVGSPLLVDGLTKTLVVSGLGKKGEFPEEVKGQFAFVRRGQIPFAEKLKNAIDAGAAGVIVYNTEPGLINGGLGFDSPIPVALIEQVEGEAVLSKLTQKTPVDVSVKVFATDYASFSGTSMATPHVAGVAALMKAARPDLTPVEVKNILQKTAQSVAASTQNETGSGLVNAEAGVQAAVDLSR